MQEFVWTAFFVIVFMCTILLVVEKWQDRTDRKEEAAYNKNKENRNDFR